MISIQNALDELERYTLTPTIEQASIMSCTGRILAEPILAAYDSPSYSNSAMDGFAVRWEDIKTLKSGREIVLNICGESQAGAPFSGLIGPQECIRISTGAIMPESTDTVVPIEDCLVSETQVQINSVREPYQHVRYQGEEFKREEPLFEAGIKLSSAQIGLMASMGVASVAVYRKAKVAVIITGQELVEYDQEVASHELRDSNRPMLITAVAEAGGKVSSVHQVGDDLDLTIQTIQAAEAKSEIIFLSGGVSMGVHDHVKAAAEACSYTRVFWKVNQKPGKPLFFAQKEGHLLLGLPGNPVSAYMCFQHYGRPIISVASGGPYKQPTIKALLTYGVVNRSERSNLFRVGLKQLSEELPQALPLERQGSHMLTSIAHAGGYFVLSGKQEMPTNTIIDVYEF